MNPILADNRTRGHLTCSHSSSHAVLGVLLFFVIFANAESHFLVQNEFLKIQLSTGHQTAFIEEFTSKSQGRNLVAPVAVSTPVPLFQIDLYESGKPITLDPHQADKLELSQPDSETIDLKADFAVYGLTVRQRLKLKPGNPTASFSIDFKLTKPRFRVGVARLPGLGLLLDPGPSATVLLPIADGALLHEPVSVLKDGEKRSYNYPGMASAQLMAAYDSHGGVLFYAGDGRGDFKMLTVRRYGKQLIMVFECVLYQFDPPEVALPFTIEVGAFSGGWERAADIYKLWARNQAWCKKLIQNRTFPAGLKETSFTLAINLRGDQSGSRIPEVPKVVQGWSQGLGMPVNVLLQAWEKNGAWIAPDYFPPFGGEAPFRQMLDTLRQHGQQSMAFLSGFNITLEKTLRPGAPAFKASQKNRVAFEASAITGPDGMPLRQGKAEEGTGRLSVLCPSTNLARKTVFEAFRKLRGYGVDYVQIDQVVGGGTPPCFSPKHGHPPVGGHSMFKATASLLDSLTASDPLATITLEEPGELFIPHVHMFHARDYMEGFWPRDGAGITGVSLFNYLYHEYSLGYGGDTAPISQPGEDPTLAIYAQAMNLINGRFPATASWVKLIPFDKVHADQRRFMQDVSAVWKGPAGKFLRQGTLLPLDHQSKDVWRLRGSASGKDFDFVTTALLGCGYKLTDGRMVVGYVNITGKPVKAKLDFASGRTGIPMNGTLLWPEVGGRESKDGAISSTVIKSGDNYTFPPFGILFLEAKS